MTTDMKKWAEAVQKNCLEPIEREMEMEMKMAPYVLEAAEDKLRDHAVAERKRVKNASGQKARQSKERWDKLLDKWPDIRANTPRKVALIEMSELAHASVRTVERQLAKRHLK